MPRPLPWLDRTHGMNSRTRKLDELGALRIIARKGKASAATVATEEGVSISNVQQIWKGRAWKHLPRNKTN